MSTSHLLHHDITEHGSMIKTLGNNGYYRYELKAQTITASTMESEHYCSYGAAMYNTWLRDILMRLEVKLKCSLIIH